MKRELNDVEKKFTMKNMKKDIEELELWEIQEKVLRGEIEMIPLKAKLALNTTGAELDKTLAQVNFFKNKIGICRDQLENGVEIKEDKSEDKPQEEK